jgi:ankyrin repeat protein
MSKATVGNRALPSVAGSLAAAGAGPLQAAAGRGDLDALRELLADPATRVDAPDAAGRTALLEAVLARQPAAVRLLLEAGADPGRADRTGLTPRAAAQAGANAEIAALLAAPR